MEDLEPFDSFLAKTHRVRFETPPPDLLPSLTAAVANATAKLGPDDRAALFGIATPSGGNAVVVIRGAKGWDVLTWIGKDWDAPGVEWGVGVIKRWKKT